MWILIVIGVLSLIILTIAAYLNYIEAVIQVAPELGGWWSVRRRKDKSGPKSYRLYLKKNDSWWEYDDNDRKIWRTGDRWYAMDSSGYLHRGTILDAILDAEDARNRLMAVQSKVNLDE